MAATGDVELIDGSGDAWVEIGPDQWWCTDPDPRLRDNVPAPGTPGARRAEVELLYGIDREQPAAVATDAATDAATVRGWLDALDVEAHHAPPSTVLSAIERLIRQAER